MAMSSEETKGGAAKKKPAMGHSQPGSTSKCDETLGGTAKKRIASPHTGFASTSHEEETLGGKAKKRIAADTGHNKSLGTAVGA